MATTDNEERLAAMRAALQRQDEELARFRALAASRPDDDEVRFVADDLEERIGALVEATHALRPAVPTRGMRA